jgi:peptide/nickel transport system permease protein
MNFEERATTSRTTDSLPVGRRSRRLRWPVRGVVANTAAFVMFCFVLLGVFGSMLTPHNPNEGGVGPQLAHPSGAFWLGTDALGRDEVSRVIAAARPALLAAGEAVLVALLLGTAVGIVSGYIGGFWDNGLSRLMDLLFAMPEYLLAILVIAIIGNGMSNAALAIGVTGIPRFARVVRGATQEIISRSYIDAAHLSGRGRLWVMWRHLIPNIASPLIVITAISLSTAEGAYAALSFLGFGERPPAADYGSMIAAAQSDLLSDPWVVAMPSVAFVILVVAFNVLGDVIRDALDPRSTAKDT